MSPFELFKALVQSVASFEAKMHFEALASAAREQVTGVFVEAVRASARVLATNTIVKDSASQARAAHVASFCEERGIATMDVHVIAGGLAHLHIHATRAVVSSIPHINAEDMRMALARTADGLLRDASYLMMADVLADHVAPPPSETTEEAAPHSGLRSSVIA